MSEPAQTICAYSYGDPPIDSLIPETWVASGPGSLFLVPLIKSAAAARLMTADPEQAPNHLGDFMVYLRDNLPVTHERLMAMDRVYYPSFNFFLIMFVDMCRRAASFVVVYDPPGWVAGIAIRIRILQSFLMLILLRGRPRVQLGRPCCLLMRSWDVD